MNLLLQEEKAESKPEIQVHEVMVAARPCGMHQDEGINNFLGENARQTKISRVQSRPVFRCPFGSLPAEVARNRIDPHES